MDDYSRAIAGYFISFDAPNAQNTALTLHQAIWNKNNTNWPVCGIPENSTQITGVTLPRTTWNKSLLI